MQSLGVCGHLKHPAQIAKANVLLAQLKTLGLRAHNSTEFSIHTGMVCWFRVLEELFAGGRICIEVEAVAAACRVNWYESFGRNNVGLLYHLLHLDVAFCWVKHSQVDGEDLYCFKEVQFVVFFKSTGETENTSVKNSKVVEEELLGPRELPWSPQLSTTH